MDPSCSDLEFFDFKNATEDEIKEIQAILKAPGSNGCVELPWEIPFKENCNEVIPKTEDADKSSTTAETKSMNVLEIVGQDMQNISPHITRLQAPVEAFVAPPTSIGPYTNTSYFMSRTIPYLRTYTHLGVPFFACSIPGTGDTNPMPSPYGQFVPVVPATVGQDKFVENETGQKNKGPSDKQLSHRSKKKLSNAEYCSNPIDSENTEAYREPAVVDEQIPVSSPVSSSINSDRPTSVPIVPLPIPPATFGVAGGTLPLHGYPPGLHALSNTQMYGPQPPSAAMYYVPVFNHPYGSYIPSPPSAPMVLPVNIRPESENTPEIDDSNEEVKTQNPSFHIACNTKSTENLNVQSNSEDLHEPCIENANDKQVSISPIAKNIISEAEDMTDYNSSSDYPPSKSISSSPDCIPEADTVAKECCKCQPTEENTKDVNRDSSRCWADLFKKPCLEVNGIDRQLSSEQGSENISNLNTEIANGKMYSVPAKNKVL